MTSRSTACLDWESRLIEGRSLVPFEPLFPEEAARALQIFDSLSIVDAAGKPTFGEAGRPWIHDFVAAVFGAYTTCFGERYDIDFALEDEGLEIEWDYSVLTQADFSTRVATAARGVAGGLMTQNEGRLMLRLDPQPDGDKLWVPTNVAFAGSYTGAGLPDGGGRPKGSPNKEEIDK